MNEQQIAAVKQALAWIEANADTQDEWDMVADLRQALEQQPVAPAIPEGWTLVPLKMTDEMLTAAKNMAIKEGFMTLIWEAAVEAAPKQRGN